MVSRSDFCAWKQGVALTATEGRQWGEVGLGEAGTPVSHMPMTRGVVAKRGSEVQGSHQH